MPMHFRRPRTVCSIRKAEAKGSETNDEYANGTEVDYDPVLAGRYAGEMLRRIADGQKNTGERLPGEDPVIP
jgi:hypothetical protein